MERAYHSTRRKAMRAIVWRDSQENIAKQVMRFSTAVVVNIIQKWVSKKLNVMVKVLQNVPIEILPP